MITPADLDKFISIVNDPENSEPVKKDTAEWCDALIKNAKYNPNSLLFRASFFAISSVSAGEYLNNMIHLHNGAFRGLRPIFYDYDLTTPFERQIYYKNWKEFAPQQRGDTAVAFQKNGTRATTAGYLEHTRYNRDLVGIIVGKEDWGHTEINKGTDIYKNWVDTSEILKIHIDNKTLFPRAETHVIDWAVLSNNYPEPAGEYFPASIVVVDSPVKYGESETAYSENGAIRAGLDSMIIRGITIAIVANVKGIVERTNAILQEPVLNVPDAPERGRYFKSVITLGFMSDIEQEYQQYKLSNKLFQIFTVGLSEKSKYEAKNILERWILSQYNDYSFRHKEGQNHVFPLFPSTDINSPSIRKMINEIVEKNISPTAHVLVNKLLRIIEEFKELPDDGESRKVSISGRKIIYGDYNALLNLRIQKLLETFGNEPVMRMLLRYEATQMGSQHWGAPEKVYDYLYKNCGVRNEAFADPLNSRLMFYPDGKFFSLFIDVDRVFGSNGNFLTADISKFSGGFMVNPPYIDSVMLETGKKVSHYLDHIKGNNVMFITFPSWTDSDAFLLLERSPWKTGQYELKKGAHYYTDPCGKIIISRFNTTLFILGKTVPKDIVYGLLKLWSLQSA